MPLKHNCGHECLLLFLPGHAPRARNCKNQALCGAIEDVRRRGFKNFSCGGVCRKTLACGTHICGEICHDGDCPPCRRKGLISANLGRRRWKECVVGEFLGGKHQVRSCLAVGGIFVGKVVIRVTVGSVHTRGKRTCPCGRRVYEGMAYDVAVSLCGATCDKLLSCGFHRCLERCQRVPH